MAEDDGSGSGSGAEGATEPGRDQDPAAVFGVLSDPTRVAILRALWAAEDPATFSELRAATEIADSGRFNYHLSKLQETFVAEAGSGYRLTMPGRRVVGALLSGAYTGHREVEPVPLETDCPACGAGMAFTYEQELARFACSSCSHETVQAPVPPGVFEDYAAAEAPAVAGRYLRRLITTSRAGFCPNCEGRVDPTVRTLGEHLRTIGVDPDDVAAGYDEAVALAVFRCRRCEEQINADLASTLATTAPVVAFHHDHGVDVTATPHWELVALDSDRAWVREQEPVRAVATYAAGDERLRVVVDDTVEVVDTERLSDPDLSPS